MAPSEHRDNVVPMDARAPIGFRTLPFNIDCEQAILGGILVNNDAYEEIRAFLRPEHFHEPVHGRIYERIALLIGEDIVADHVTIRDAFEHDEALRDLDGGMYLARLARSAETIIKVIDYAKVVVDCWLKRCIIAHCEEWSARAFDPAALEFGDEQLDMMRADMETLARDLPALDGPQPLSSIISAILDRVERIEHQEERAYYSTGIKALDGHMGGGLHLGEVYSFEARPESFKTGLMGTLALNLMMQGVPILYCALEMGAIRIVERLAASVGKINSRDFRSVDRPLALQDAVRTFSTTTATAKAWWHSQPGMTFDRLRSVVTDAYTKHGIKVVFVDYWQLVGGIRKGQNKVDHLEQVAGWMEQFASQRDVAIVSASQTNRDQAGLWGDGLFRSSTWMKRIHKVSQKDTAWGDVEGLWLEHLKDRHGSRSNIGSELAPALYITKDGPVAKDWGSW